MSSNGQDDDIEASNACLMLEALTEAAQHGAAGHAFGHLMAPPAASLPHQSPHCLHATHEIICHSSHKVLQTRRLAAQRLTDTEALTVRCPNLCRARLDKHLGKKQLKLHCLHLSAGKSAIVPFVVRSRLFCEQARQWLITEQAHLPSSRKSSLC